MSKVRCGVCENENDGICSIKKVGVRINKPRNCGDYVYNEGKLKVKHNIPTVKFGYKEQQEEKVKKKEEIEEYKNQYLKNQNHRIDMVKQMNPNSKYPLTGDLSRFTTTASRKGD